MHYRCHNKRALSDGVFFASAQSPAQMRTRGTVELRFESDDRWTTAPESAPLFERSWPQFNRKRIHFRSVTSDLIQLTLKSHVIVDLLYKLHDDTSNRIACYDASDNLISDYRSQLRTMLLTVYLWYLWQSIAVATNDTLDGTLVTRELAILPSLENIAVKMHLFDPVSDENITRFVQFTSNERPMKELSEQLDPAKETIFLTHGWLGSFASGRFWLDPILQMSKGRAQVVFVDWSNAASSSYYLPTLSNLRPVANIWAGVISRLIDRDSFDPMKIRLIGFSLGAHLVGFTGKLLTGKYKLARITGLEPANAGFEMASEDGSLFKTDAHFVDVIHTASGSVFQGFSRADALGCVDFYPNGAKYQPNCNRDLPFGALGGFFSSHRPCSHDRAVVLFSKDWSRTPTHQCQPVAYACNSYQEFLEGKCATCDFGLCALMGFYWDNIYPLDKLQSCGVPRSFYIQDAGDGSCVYHYQVIVTTREPAFGQMVLEMPKVSRSFSLTVNRELESGAFSGLVTLSSLIVSDSAMIIEWSPGGLLDSLWRGDSSIDVTKVTINYLSHWEREVRSNHSITMCAGKIRSGARVSLKPCSK